MEGRPNSCTISQEHRFQLMIFLSSDCQPDPRTGQDWQIFYAAPHSNSGPHEIQHQMQSTGQNLASPWQPHTSKPLHSKCVKMFPWNEEHLKVVFERSLGWRWDSLVWWWWFVCSSLQALCCCYLLQSSRKRRFQLVH